MTLGPDIFACGNYVPLLTQRFSIQHKGTFTSWIGIAALLLSFFTTYLSGQGLAYLTVHGQGDIMPALILGSVAAAAFLGGVPVGPLITSGILAIIVRLVQ